MSELRSTFVNEANDPSAQAGGNPPMMTNDIDNA